MKHLIVFAILMLVGVYAFSQELDTDNVGTVTFVTGQHVYVKFTSTENLKAGDTLFISKNGSFVPGIKVEELSSISCVGSPMDGNTFKVGDKTLAHKGLVPTTSSESVAEEVTPGTRTKLIVKDSVADVQVTKKKADFSGRLSVASYTGISSNSDLSERLRYTLVSNYRNIGGSKLSAETYVTFSHKLGDWNLISQNLFNGLKIYSLAFNYALNPKNSIWIGRRINPRLSNMGAVDGLQYEFKAGQFTVGAIAGSRPDSRDYGFNFNLLQYGGYINHEHSGKLSSFQTSLAFVEQKNAGLTDRRFAYIQHSNTPVKNITLFGSMELDLYNKVFNSQDSILMNDRSPRISNLYASVRYRVTKRFSVSLSYSERKNVIYYETYKDFIQRLLESASTTGYNAQLNYRTKHFTVGCNGGYRLGTNDSRASKNLYGYLTFPAVPWLNASATLSATIMETSYLNSDIYGLSFARDIFKGKVYADLGYRMVHYTFVSQETAVRQHMGELGLNWRIMSKLSCSLNYEGTFEKGKNYNNVYVNLSKRF
ncbi:MAG: hypothetical protein IPH88_12975 [Bacteroidales bacterium]|nr:hypothetical protein [Bacteroidales bacterium]